MAVSVVGSPNLALNPGRVDVRLPVGLWHADILVTGDGSGGSATSILRFRSSTDPVLPLAFSVDQLSGQREDSVIEHPLLTLIGFSPSGFDGTVFNTVMVLEALDTGARVATVPWPSNPVFLGSPVRGSNADINLTWVTNTNAVGYHLRCSGTVWLYEGMLEISGVQAPQSSIPTEPAGRAPSTGAQSVIAAEQAVVVPRSAVSVSMSPTGRVQAGPDLLDLAGYRGASLEDAIQINRQRKLAFGGLSTLTRPSTPQRAIAVNRARARTFTPAPVRRSATGPVGTPGLTRGPAPGSTTRRRRSLQARPPGARGLPS